MDNRIIKIGVVGGGASGLFFSYLIKKKLGKIASVTIFEKNNKVGKKILATGNGKCNLSNQNLEAGMYNSHFGEQIAISLSVDELKKAFLELGIITKTDSEGRIYPYSLSANSVLDALYNANNSLGVIIKTDYQVLDINYQNKMFYIGEEAFDYLVVACGGKAGTQFNHLVAQNLTKFGHKWVIDHPALCALSTFEDTSSLNGLRIKAKVSVDEHNFNGEVLFKNNGLSGIAIFEASRYVTANKIIHLDLFSDYSLEKLQELVDNVNKFTYSLPKMVAKDILNRANGNLIDALRIAKDYTFTIKGFASYENSQIMVGGIDTDDLTLDLESKLIPHLFIIGEAVNVDATTGGYNLHFAWASSTKAANKITKDLK